MQCEKSGVSRNFKNLAQIGQILFVIAHVFGRCVRQFGDRLAVAPDHLDDDLQRLKTQVVGQVGPNAKGELAAPSELL